MNKYAKPSAASPLQLSIPAQSSSTSAVTSTPVTIKRPGCRFNNWQEFIEREQNSVHELIQDSFAELCKSQQQRGRSGSFASPHSSRLSDDADEHEAFTPSRAFNSSSLRRPATGAQQQPQSTMPRTHLRQSSPANTRQEATASQYLDDLVQQTQALSMALSSRCSQELMLPPPLAIHQLESLYAPMKNLHEQLPNARKYSGNHMPRPHPLLSSSGDWSEVDAVKQHRANPREDDLESEACSVMGDIPPPLPPIQSRVLLNHQPVTPKWSRPMVVAPPLPPKRTSSKSNLSRPVHLSVGSIMDDRRIYANTKSALHRSSLMSTGSSENSSEAEVSIAPLTPTSDNMSGASSVFWPALGAASPSDEHRSVSQIGDACDVASNSRLSPGGGSGVYVKMRSVEGSSRESHYMNVLYNAVQDHPDDFVSVESALSPYLAMSGAKKTSLPDANEAVAMLRSGSGDRKAKGRSRSNSASRLHEVTSGCRKKLTASLSSSSSKTSSKSKALAEFRELMQEVERKRHYRVGLNIFNSKPELGVEYLVQKNFLELSPVAVARFLLENTCLSREKVGEYLGCLQNPFCMKVLSCFMDELDFSGLRIDKALRLLMQNVRVSGEAQKIERMMEVFGKRYNRCNPSFANKLRAQDSVVTLAFAVMLLNTDLHTPTLKEEKKMSADAFVNNLRGVDSGRDFDSKLLKTIYKGIKKQELTCAADHVTQTLAIQQSLIPSSSMGVRRTLSSSSSASNSFSSPSHQSSQSSLPQLVEPHRRLVCLCRLYEVTDLGARDSSSVATEHPRDVFLFNDVMVLTKRSGNGPAAYTFRELAQLRGLEVTLFRTPAYSFGVQVSRKRDKSVVATFNAGSEHDRFKFVMDLQESIFEMDLMEKVLRDFNR